MVPCDLCGKQVQCGPHRYDSHKWCDYGMFVCGICNVVHEDGVGRMFEAKFEQLLQDKGIALPARNQKGCYPRGPSF